MPNERGDKLERKPPSFDFGKTDSSSHDVISMSQQITSLTKERDEAVALVAEMRRLLRLWSRSCVSKELQAETDALLANETGRNLLEALRDLTTERDELRLALEAAIDWIMRLSDCCPSGMQCHTNGYTNRLGDLSTCRDCVRDYLDKMAKEAPHHA